MKRGDLVKYKNSNWIGVITRVKHLMDKPPGIEHVELIWIYPPSIAESPSRNEWDRVTPSLLRVMSSS